MPLVRPSSSILSGCVLLKDYVAENPVLLQLFRSRSKTKSAGDLRRVVQKPSRARLRPGRAPTKLQQLCDYRDRFARHSGMRKKLQPVARKASSTHSNQLLTDRDVGDKRLDALVKDSNDP